MRKLKENKMLMRALLVVFLVAAVAGPALAEHFDWGAALDDGDAEVTAADAHVTCPEPEEDGTGTPPLSSPTQEECDEAVQDAYDDLAEYDHPENHGKYVSFVAHCLKGMKGKGTSMSEIAQASEDEQAETAVRLCAEFSLNEDELTQSPGQAKKVEATSDDEEIEAEDEPTGDGHGRGHGKGGGKGKK